MSNADVIAIDNRLAGLSGQLADAGKAAEAVVVAREIADSLSGFDQPTVAEAPY